MDRFPKIRIELPNGTIHGGKVSIDGFEIRAIRKVTVQSELDNVTVVSLDVLGDVTIDADALLELTATNRKRSDGSDLEL